MNLSIDDFKEGQLLLIDKPLKWTSFQVVNKLRWLISNTFNIKKIKVGHAGTLDPLATGLLLICTGKMTKKIEEYQGMPKEYTGTFYIGATTPSYDLETEIDHTFPSSHITWVTQKPSNELLANNPLIDRVLTTERDDQLVLSALLFDFGFIVDKSLKAMGVLKNTQCDLLFGFTHDSRTGAIVPATMAAQELWEIGLNDHKKFFENKKSETQLICESLELSYRRDSYLLRLTSKEQELALQRKRLWSEPQQIVVGINTGCSNMISAKKLTIAMHQKIIREIYNEFGKSVSIVLLGGREDSDRNLQIARDAEVFNSPSEGGLRDGIASVAACDIVLTGDSLGMHIGIALEKYVAAWFGPTCAHEIDFYDRGEAIYTSAGCSPCWKRTCQKATMCYDLVSVKDFVQAVARGIEWHQKSLLSKQPFSEICY